MSYGVSGFDRNDLNNQFWDTLWWQLRVCHGRLSHFWANHLQQGHFPQRIRWQGVISVATVATGTSRTRLSQASSFSRWKRKAPFGRLEAFGSSAATIPWECWSWVFQEGHQNWWNLNTSCFIQYPNRLGILVKTTCVLLGRKMWTPNNPRFSHVFSSPEDWLTPFKTTWSSSPWISWARQFSRWPTSWSNLMNW